MSAQREFRGTILVWGPRCATRLPMGGGARDQHNARPSLDPKRSPVHHLINPLTGAPAISDLTAVSVLSAQAWWAEAVAKATLITGSKVAAELIVGIGATGVLVSGPDHIRLLPGLSVDTHPVPSTQ